jgi:glutathione S-transferase
MMMTFLMVHFPQRPLLYAGAKEIPQELKDNVVKVLQTLEGFLTADYFAGNNLTIADFSILANVTSVVVSTHDIFY